MEDMNDIFANDAVVSFTMDPATTGYQSGGRHVEFGFAYALGKKMFIVGPVENVFHSLSGVRQFATFEDFLEYLATEHPVSASALQYAGAFGE